MPSSLVGSHGREIDHTMTEFQTTDRRMIAQVVRIRSALRRRGFLYLAQQAWARIGRRLGWALTDPARELDNHYWYQDWVLDHPAWALDLAAQRRWARTTKGLPVFSLLIRPTVGSPMNLSRTLRSLRRQTYPHWSTVILKDDVQTPAIASSLVSAERCEYVGIMRSGDTLSAEALYEFARAIVDRQPRPDVLYCDEDHLASDGRMRCRPNFKPSWSPEMLLSYHYTGRLTVAQRTLFDEIRGVDASAGEAAEWDLMLRLSEHTDQIVRVPRCLYHHAAATTLHHPDAKLRYRQVLESHLRRKGRVEAQAVPQRNGTFRVTWSLGQPPLVSVIIPTRNNPDLIRKCVEGLITGTDYPNKELILVDNESTDPETLLLYDQWSSSDEVSIIPFNQPFNYSAACNLGAAAARGDYLLFLNNDIEVIEPAWLEELVRWAQLPGVGVVGTKLVYPNGTMQHAGMALSRDAWHLFVHESDDLETAPGDVLFGTPNIYRNVTMLTGACQLLKRAIFNEIGGYDERALLVASDGMLCLDALHLGYRNVYTPYARLIHHESYTRGRTDEGDDRLLFAQRLDELNFWEDPFLHPELHPGNPVPAPRPIWMPTSRDALRKYVDELTIAMPRKFAAIPQDRSSLQRFLGGLTQRSTSAHASLECVARDVAEATWFVIDLVRRDEEISRQYPRALSDGPEGDFCRWLCSEGIGRYGLPATASETIRQAFASQPALPVRRLIEDRGMVNPSLRVARVPSLLAGLLFWLVENRKALDVSDRQIWWFLLESVEDPVRELMRVYDTNPVWQKHFPDPLSPPGWKRFTDWIRNRYGFDATACGCPEYMPSKSVKKLPSVYPSQPAENSHASLTRHVLQWESRDAE
jgi:GT2 family glycosyltransferase